MWVREGECCRCGQCCRSGDPFNGERGRGQVAGACPLLVLLPDGVTYACTDRQDPYYLNGCALWPSLPEHIAAYPGCSYTFRWEADA